ncbi:ARM repeat-containing protein [Rhizoclosmatium globosum]|uniref:ARM repeat-containing protein n=1 Tax=Rhizoclosmatium globosum TaxID=329046 RepID=A0A1Y2CVD3_9FUNG|nr:ARM repeat-containing protein [Rhizoclosmatium globosum]|eukprot:ORY50963.1 ARM repeat-containing protein [Rhizoclosmatium globosum]
MTLHARHTAKCQSAIEQLTRTTDAAGITAQLRSIKNSVIGNRTKKEVFVSSDVLAEYLATLLSFEGDVKVQVEAARIAVVAASRRPHRQCLTNLVAAVAGSWPRADLRLADATLRATKEVLTKSLVSQNTFAANLIRLLNPPNLDNDSNTVQHQLRINELSASIIASLSSSLVSQDAQRLLVASDALPKLLVLLDKAYVQFNKMQESVLDAISCLVKDNSDAGRAFVGLFVDSNQSERSVVALLRLLKDGKHAMTRLLAASCLSNLYKIVNLENQRIPSQLLLPTLINLFSDPSLLLLTSQSENLALLERAPLVLSDLVSESEPLQKLALEGDAISRLAELLLTPQVRGSLCVGGSVIPGDETMGEADKSGKNILGKGSKSGSNNVDIDVQSNLLVGDLENGTQGSKTYERVAESCLLALAAISSLREDSRNKSSILNFFLSLSNHYPLRRLKSGQLHVNAHDRSLAHPLFTLLQDPNVTVQTYATATLCNIVLDFSPMKKTVIESGGVERLVALIDGCIKAGSDGPDQVLLNSIWALKNLLYQAGSDVKRKVMEELGWDMLKKLIFDERIGIQEQAINLLRNLVCGKEDDIDTVFSGFGEAALSILFDKKLTEPSNLSTEYDKVVLQTLYVVVNIATGSERHKGLVVGSHGLMTNVLKFMNHEAPLIRLATVWCILNLTEPDDLYPKLSHDRLDQLRAYGFHEQLQKMLADSDPDVRDRVKTALKNLGGYGADGLDLMDIDGRHGGMEMEGMQDLSSYLAGGGRSG